MCPAPHPGFGLNADGPARKPAHRRGQLLNARKCLPLALAVEVAVSAVAAAAGLAGTVAVAAEAGVPGLAAVAEGTLDVGTAATVSRGPLSVVLAELLLEAAVALEIAAAVALVGTAVAGGLAAVVQLEVDQLAADPGAGQGAQLFLAQVGGEPPRGVAQTDVDPPDRGGGDPPLVAEAANDRA